MRRKWRTTTRTRLAPAVTLISPSLTWCRTASRSRSRVLNVSISSLRGRFPHQCGRTCPEGGHFYFNQPGHFYFNATVINGARPSIHPANAIHLPGYHFPREVFFAPKLIQTMVDSIAAEPASPPTDSPLRDRQDAAGAVWTEVAGRRVARHYGDSAGEYRAVREGAGLAERGDRARIRMWGKDPVKMIHGLITNDLLKAAPGQGVYAAMLTPKGRTIAELRIFRRELAAGTEVLVEMPRAALE